MIELYQSPQMINTLYQSSNSYLALLEESKKGIQEHPASEIKLIEDAFETIENKRWPIITCILPNHRKFEPETGATLVPANHPGCAIPAQIIKYDPKSGLAKIAVEENPADSTGNLVIDFKWLIRRLIQWLEKHGTNIGNPFLLTGYTSTPYEFSISGAMSDEQIASVNNLLGNPVAYVWGPPGTGKTRHVLAETVVHLIRQGKKVLVTAATNLAVENALDAILHVKGVEKKDVLRIGVPGGEFRDRWPECCEGRAFEAKLEQLKQEENDLIERRGGYLRKPELEKELKNLTAEISHTDAYLDAAESEVTRLKLESDRIAAELAKVISICEDLKKQLNEKIQAFDALGLASRETEISILENEQTNLMGERQEAEAKIASLQLWEKLFTKRKEILNQRHVISSQRLDSVEVTLLNKRNRYNEASKEGQTLEVSITELKGKLSTEEVSRQKNASQLQLLTQEQTAAKENLETVGKNNQIAKEKMAKILNELAKFALLNSLPTNQEQFDEVIAELDRVQNELAKISHDLSNKLVLGMTLDGFIGLTMNQSLDFDHVVVDEAGYAPLAKVIPLCSLHCPISLLGDHRQLGPVYEGKNHVKSECYWGTSALYLEDAFDPGIGTSFEALIKRTKRPPRFENLRRSQLSHSYRFGVELADLLDRHFYMIGLTSRSPSPIMIKIIKCPPYKPPQKQKRENHCECDQIAKWVERWLNWKAEDKGTLAVISPYTNQVDLLRKELSNRFKVHPDYDSLDVLTVHKAQGREWDTVFFSASDTGNLDGNKPWYSDTLKLEGKLVVNTAISRAKKNLLIFCDREFWATRQSAESLLSDICNNTKYHYKNT